MLLLRFGCGAQKCLLKFPLLLSYERLDEASAVDSPVGRAGLLAGSLAKHSSDSSPPGPGDRLEDVAATEDGTPVLRRPGPSGHAGKLIPAPTVATMCEYAWLIAPRVSMLWISPSPSRPSAWFDSVTLM